jgi:hypothetical protein
VVWLGGPPAPAEGGHRIVDGVGVAVSAGLVLAGLTLAVGSASAGSSGAGSAGAIPHGAASGGHGVLVTIAGCVLVVLGCAFGLPVLRRLLPAGTLRARYGLPATIASRSLITFCYFGADAFVTLAITILRHRSPVVAGVVVTGSTLAWTAGAWVQARMNTRWEGRRLIRTGLGVILVGIGGLAAMLASTVPVATGIVAWTVAGFGMGLAYAPISLLMLKNAPPGREGWASASLNLADVLGSALGIGIGGGAISATVRFGWPLWAGLGAAFAITAMAGVAGLVISRRLPPSLPAGSATAGAASAEAEQAAALPSQRRVP